MPFIIGIFVLFIFFFVMYLVVKSAVNNSELLKEIKVLLMNAQNDESRK